jgi:hypothetical protein
MESTFGIRAEQAAAAPTSRPSVEERILEEKLAFAQNKLKQIKDLGQSKLASEAALREAEHEFRLAELNLEQARQIRPSRLAPDTQRRLLKDLFTTLGISMTPPRNVFYNPHIGIVMVQVAEEEMPLVEAAMETLGGEILNVKASSFPGSGGAIGEGGGLGARGKPGSRSGYGGFGSNRTP